MNSNDTPEDKKGETPPESASYGLGVLAGVAQSVMPIRMWLTLIASGVLFFVVIRTESLLTIGRAL